MVTARLKRPLALCMTGISGSGKTTLANAIAKKLKSLGVLLDVIDGDDTREMIGNLFGHSREERMKMSRVNQAIGHYLLRNNVGFILAVVAPYEEMRSQFRQFFGEAYVQVYVKASVATCIERDVKGLYKMSREGDLEHLNGMDDLFEEPQHNELVIDTEMSSVEEASTLVIEYLYAKGYIE